MEDPTNSKSEENTASAAEEAEAIERGTEGVNGTGTSSNEEEKEKTVAKMKKKRRVILNGILIFPMTCAVIITCLGMWVIATMIMEQFCELETETAYIVTDLKFPNNNDDKWASRCRYLKLAKHYPFPHVHLLTALVAVGGVLRCISTALLFRQAQSSLEDKHLVKWIGATAPIVWITLFSTAFVFKPLLHDLYPHDDGRNNEHGFYNLCDILRIILYFSFLDLIINTFTLFSMDFFKYNDAILEKEYTDVLNAGARINQIR